MRAFLRISSPQLVADPAVLMNSFFFCTKRKTRLAFTKDVFFFFGMGARDDARCVWNRRGKGTLRRVEHFTFPFFLRFFTARAILLSL
jgi:hypothetical protein